MFSKFVIQCLAMLSNNEVTEGLLIAVLGANFVLLFFIARHVATDASVFRQVRRLAIAITEKIMDCDELIDGLLSCSGEQFCNDEETAGDSLVSPDACSGDTAGQRHLLRNDKVTGQKAVQDKVQNYRERLASVAAGGQGRRYGLLAYGKALTASHIGELDDSEKEMLYARYEARLGTAMTKTLGSAALQLYAGVVSMLIPIPAENQLGLIADLEGDPFAGHALSSATCELYHRYGMILAPLTAAFTTVKHCQFGHQCPAVINDGNQADGGEPAGSSAGTARRNSFALRSQHIDLLKG